MIWSIIGAVLIVAAAALSSSGAIMFNIPTQAKIELEWPLAGNEVPSRTHEGLMKASPLLMTERRYSGIRGLMI